VVVLYQLDQRLVEHICIENVVEFQRQAHDCASRQVSVVEIVQGNLLRTHVDEVVDC
jgi:hypothetical protein